MIIKFKNFEPSKLSVTDLEENQRSKGQKISYVRYGDTQPLIRSPEIQLTTYGIPREGEYYKDDASRSFLKVPLDVNDENHGEDITVFHGKLTELDKLMDSDSMREHIFGSKKAAKGWVYQPLVREAMQQSIDNSDSDSEDDTKQVAQFRPPYIKVKLRTNYDSGKIETTVFKKDTTGRNKVKVSTLQELERLVTYRSTVRMVIMPNKLWAMKNSMQGKRYGLSLKMTHLEVEPVVRSSLKDVYEGDVFGDSENDDDDDDSKVDGTISDDDDDDSVQSAKLNTKSLDAGLDSDDSDDSDSDSDSEEEKVVAKKKKSSKKSSKNTKKKSSKSATNSA